ncbi:DNA-binding transcriptional ArsR family regulator [Kitasatospora sp. GP30]|uniref:ArsR/SmtB family transcription factor n=1 Tax=Kitasatospora sp. GP30 TaxID=3035084 RepID=UPI000C70434C|nr:helix-turn-helix domain-containing protein [Kitasatospora sp. GP30]MDH6144568.1 DNA-binding transcriptional ArsR family regulator [Kitasatospora sp. GP30]
MTAQTREDPAAASHRTPPVHTDPADVPLEAALIALADPVRQSLVRELAGAADWERNCGSFDVPVTKATLSRHFAVLRDAGLLEQRDAGAKRLNRLRRAEFDAQFPGLIDLVLRHEEASQ